MPTASEPWSAEEAAEALRAASAEGLRVSIDREGGDVALSTKRLDRILEHEPGDLTAIVEAGVRVGELNDRLAERGQTLALDPPGDPTIGACIAGNLSGPRRHRYGTARDLVIGVTVVLADGTVASSGGKVVKNVAGYDLGKLFTGSHGRLGLIVRAGLRLHPRPAFARTLVVPVDDPGRAERLAQAVHRSTLVPAAVDLLWPSFLALLFEGGERAVDAQLREARALLGGAEDDGGVWQDVLAWQELARGSLPFPPGELARALEGLPEALVRVGAGVAYVPAEAPDSRSEGHRRLAEAVRARFDPQGVLV